MLASCKGCQDAPAPDASIPEASVEAAASVTPEASVIEAGTVVDTPPALVEEPSTRDAGASSCRLVYGPAEQPFRGPATLVISGQTLDLVTNDSGKPRLYPIPLGPIPPKGAPSVVPPRPSSFTGMRWPACEVAGRFTYCQGPGGTIIRSSGPEVPPQAGRLPARQLSDAKEIAKSRSGTRIAAASLGPDHSAVAFLDSKHTTEGMMLQAFVAVDEQEPVRLSDDGAGATTLRFLSRGDTAIAVYLDTRMAMVPVHARPVSFQSDRLSLGADTVLFVGGAPERGIDFGVASAGGKGFVFVPMPRDTIEFGMAALPIEEPPKENIEAVWSRYPNGLDPAPLGAAPARDGKGAWVARIRPRDGAVGSPRALELGRSDDKGAFTSYGEIASGKGVTDVTLIEDPAGAVWILYGDSTITWLERRVCR
jgi:hypothetical protein